MNSILCVDYNSLRMAYDNNPRAIAGVWLIVVPTANRGVRSATLQHIGAAVENIVYLNHISLLRYSSTTIK